MKVHRTTCEYCLGIIEYKDSNLLKDRFDTVFVICPLCDSQVEVPIPEDIDLDDIPLDDDIIDRDEEDDGLSSTES